MAIELGDQVFHPGHGWVSTFASCDCVECTMVEEEGTTEKDEKDEEGGE